MLLTELEYICTELEDLCTELEYLSTEFECFLQGWNSFYRAGRLSTELAYL
jgi:hypothetical protein